MFSSSASDRLEFVELEPSPMLYASIENIECRAALAYEPDEFLSSLFIDPSSLPLQAFII